MFGILDDDQKQKAGDRLAEIVEAAGYTISTGFAGTPLVSDALSSTGHLDEAYKLLLEKQCPSFLYPVTMGATTIWERWDSVLPDGTLQLHRDDLAQPLRPRGCRQLAAPRRRWPVPARGRAGSGS